MLCYFQGFHDIVQVVLLVLGAEAAYPAIESISLFRIRDYMLPTMDPVKKHLALLPCILYAADLELAKHLTLPNPLYALPAALTLYAHQIEQYSDIARLFDFILAHEPVMSIYLFAAIIMSRRAELLEFAPEEDEILFAVLQKLPQPLNLEPLIARALEVFQQFPPNRLPGRAWRGVSSSSVLKSTHPGQPLNVADAEKCFRKQAAEVQWEKRMQKAMQTALRNRLPITAGAVALGMGILSLYLRRSGHDQHLVSFAHSLLGMVRR
jgi:TBC1 domain family member 20